MTSYKYKRNVSLSKRKIKNKNTSVAVVNEYAQQYVEGLQKSRDASPFRPKKGCWLYGENIDIFLF
jgi:hypothetical protein